VVVFLLLIVTVAGSLITWSRCSPGQPITISIPPEEKDVDGGIFITGAITNPGYYPLTANDSIDALLRDAGGTTEGADLSNLGLFVPVQGQEPLPQRININQAEAWLLEALPGIGPARAQAIIDYRVKNGMFRSADEITGVEDIGPATFERIKSLITISE